MRFPLYPVYLVDIAGSALVIVLSLWALRIAKRISKLDKENILKAYMLWIAIALTVFGFSRGLGHIIQYVLVFSGHKEVWNVLSPISGSINTLSFIFIGAVSLFFIRIDQAYRKILEDKKRIEEINIELLKLNEDMEALIGERTLNMMALSIADKVRNPATVIGGTVQRILKTEGLTEPLKERLLDFLYESQKLDSIVRDYEMILKTKHTIFQYEDLVEIVKSVLPLVEKDIRDKSINLEFEFPDTPLKFNANRQLVRVAVVHVLKNAIEATPEGGSIKVSAGRLNDQIYVDITDTGPGIAEENISKIFSLFFSTKKHRLGMGLPLVKQIVEEHKGVVQVKSKPGEGSTFRLLFPSRWREEF